MKNIFVYGSLMFDSVWQRVVSGSYIKKEGQLFGYSRFCIIGEHYPGLIEKPGTVNGIIWLDVNEADIERLDQFEGEYYSRNQVFVADNHDRCLDCDSYVIRKDFQHLLSKNDWDAELFEKNYLEQFIQRYAGFKPIDK